ncbi:Hsp70 family protein, partial [Streptomyces sp. PSKA30]|uniref:Hsp70 family protein n=1 Tax=Streptomyces sp. PSKA30 TaxID=2874597 RepID=UPI001CD14288
VLEFYSAFKSADLEDGGRTRRAVELFVRHVVQALTGTPETDDAPHDVIVISANAPTRWLFGVPSGWSTHQRDEYRDLLAGLCPGEVEVLPESRAALLYGRESRDLPDPLRQLVGGTVAQGSSVVIDLGSSTADYTVVTGLFARPLDTGNPALGASLIDRELMRRTVEGHDDRERLLEALEDPSSRSILEFRCRRTKESFFVAADPLEPEATSAGETVEVRTSAGESIRVQIWLTSDLLDEITNAPLAPLNGVSWRQAFRDDLEKVRAALGGDCPDLVMMTGGASRMQFAQNIVREVFSQSQVVLGAEPEYAIAKGLVIAGQTRIRVEGFRKEIGDFTASGRIESIIDEKLPELAGKLGTVMTENLVNEHVIPAVLRWRNGELDLVSDIETEVARTREEYLSSPAFRSRVEAEAEAWSKNVSALVDTRTAEICHRWNIPPGALSLSSPFVPRTASPVGDYSDLAVDNLNTIGNVAVGAVAYIAGVIGAVAVAVSLNPVGAAVAAIVGVVVLVVAAVRGKEEAMKYAKTRRMPGPLRKLITERHLLGKIRSKAEEDSTEETAAEEFAATFLSEQRHEIIRLVATTVREHLETAARYTELLIQPEEGPELS